MSSASRNHSLYTHSVVSDHRWIHSNELRPGMYVSELDIPWENSTFMYQGFYVDSADDVTAVQRQAAYIRVKTEKVAKINPGGYKRFCRR